MRDYSVICVTCPCGQYLEIDARCREYRCSCGRVHDFSVVASGPPVFGLRYGNPATGLEPRTGTGTGLESAPAPPTISDREGLK